MKKLLSVMLACLLIVSILPISAITASAATDFGVCGDNLTWNFNEETGTLTISGTGDMTNYLSGYPSVPWYNHHRNIESVVIDNGVTSIGAYAFYDCYALTEIKIPYGVSYIGTYAFFSCSGLTEITIPNSLTSIDGTAFKSCYNLKTVNNYSRFSITKGSSAHGYVGYYADKIVNCCGENLTWELDDSTGVLTISGSGTMLDYSSYTAVPWYRYAINAIVIGGSVTSIGDYAFYRCSGLTEIAIPNSVTSIGNKAFWGCSNVADVTLHNELVDIGAESFDESVVIFGYTGSVAESYANTNGNVFYSRNGTVNNSITWNYDRGVLYITGVGDMSNYNLFTSTPWYNFSSHIKSVEIGKQITSVGTYSFYGCDNLIAIATDNENLIFGQYSVNANTALTFYGYEGGSFETYAKNNSFNFYAHLKAPTVTEITPDTITLEKNSGWLYSLDKINWFSNNVFSNLSECTKYTVYIRRVEGLTPMATRVSSGTDVITLPYPTPDKPTLKEVTADTIEVVIVDGLEYSIDKLSWNSTGKFTGLKCLTSYRVYARPITNIVAAQKISDALAVTTPDYPTPDAPILDAVTDTTITVKAVSGYEYSLDKVEWTATGKFTGLTIAQTYSIYSRPITTIPEALKVSEALVVTTLKSTVATPAAPIIESYTGEKIVLKAISGYEYSSNGKDWQISNEFENIAFDTLYNFYQRVAETDTEYVSESSTVTKIIVPSAPTICFVGATTLSVDVRDDYEYSLDKIYWQNSGDFNNLISNLEYTIYCRPIRQNALYQAISDSTVVELNGKDRAETPNFPTVSSKTDTSVILTAISGYEYKMDNGEWQDSNVFTGLLPNSTHTFYQRIKETDTTYASEISESIDVTTDKYLDSIVIINAPDKFEYFEGEEFDSTGIVVKALYRNNYSEDITDYQISGYASTPGIKTITVSYQGKTDTFTVFVNEVIVTEISVDNEPNKLTYFVGDEIDLDGLEITAQYNNGTSDTVTDYEISGFDSSTSGTKTITVTYEGKTATFEVIVNPVVITEISVTNEPNKLTYFVGDEIDLSGLEITAQYNNGTSDTVTDYEISGFDSSTSGTKTITVTYEGKTATFEVIVKARVSAPKITVTNESNGIKVAWSAVTNADKYYVYASVFDGTNWSDWKYLKGTTGTYITDTGRASGTKIRYRAYSIDGDYKSGASAECEIVRLPNTTVTTANVTGGIKVSWAKITGATKYYVYRSVYSSGKWSDWAYIKGTTGLTYTDTGVTNGSYVRYMVKSLDSKYSSAYTATGTIRRMSTPTNVKSENVTNGVKISWSKVTGAQKYYVYKRTLVNGEWSAWSYCKGTTGLYTTDTAVSSGNYVQYKVRAIDRSYTSDYGVIGTLRYLATPTVKSENTANGVKVSWNKVDGAQKYYVYASTFNGTNWTGWKYVKGTTGTAFTDTSVSDGTKIRYRVKAIDRTYESAFGVAAVLTRISDI